MICVTKFYFNFYQVQARRLSYFFKSKEETIGSAVSSELLETAEALLGRGSLTHQQVSTGLAALSYNIKSCHACLHQRQLYGRPRQEASGARGLSAASAVSRSIGEDNMLGERARQHQGGSQLPQASFDINIKFSSMPTLAEEEVFLEGEVQVQP